MHSRFQVFVDGNRRTLSFATALLHIGAHDFGEVGEYARSFGKRKPSSSKYNLKPIFIRGPGGFRGVPKVL